MFKRRLSGLGVLRGVAGGAAEEARTRGFPSLAFARFGFVAFPDFTPVSNLGISATWVRRNAAITRLAAFLISSDRL